MYALEVHFQLFWFTKKERLRNAILSVPPYSFVTTSSLFVASPEKFIVMTLSPTLMQIFFTRTLILKLGDKLIIISSQVSFLAISSSQNNVVNEGL